jgi:hypothetical protein
VRRREALASDATKNRYDILPRAGRQDLSHNTPNDARKTPVEAPPIDATDVVRLHTIPGTEPFGAAGIEAIKRIKVTERQTDEVTLEDINDRHG